MDIIYTGGAVTPDNIVKLTTGASPVQIVILILFGCIFFWAIIWSVNWLINIKMGDLPKDVKEIRERLATIQQQQTRIEGRLWTEKEVNDAITTCILRHSNECPARRQKQ